jgi:hypothetical protein
VQRLVHMSTDLARQIGMMLEDSQNGISGKVNIDSSFSKLLNIISILFTFIFYSKLFLCTH